MYDDYNEVVNILLPEAQEAERDMREQAREAEYFVDKRDGQWEPEVWNSHSDRPRYTFDKVNPYVDQVAGEIRRASFDSKVRPSGGDATKETAELYDGIIRNIESMSGAVNVYNAAAKRMIVSGLNGWMVNQRYVDDDSFDQDLVIEQISDFTDRVWFDPQSIEQDRSDAEYCFLLTQMSKRAYEKKYPEGSGQSVSEDRDSNVYYYKAESVVVGQVFFKKKVPKELVRMSNGAVYTVDDDYERVRDELASIGVTEDSRRNRKVNRVYSRKFDGGGWLEDEQETIFSWLPIIPCISNFKITEGKSVYRGLVENLMDHQRVYNYIRSRQVEEGALAPRAKYWVTEEMAAGHENELETLNTNSDAVQYFNPDDRLPGYIPQQNGGAQINPGLDAAAAAAGMDLRESAGINPAGMPEGGINQSGIAIELLQDKGSIGASGYSESLEIAISHTARVLVDAIPKVISQGRQVRVLSEGGSYDMTTIGEQVIDEQTGQIVVLNDLTKGVYDVVCSSGKSFSSRQQETLAAIEKLAVYDPSVIAEAGDIIYNNVEAPGMDAIADRKRAALVNAGAIPPDQLTDEEQQQIAQAQQMAAQNQQPDAMMVAAQAEMTKAQADLMEAQLKQQELQLKAAELQQKGQALESDRQLQMAKLQQGGQKDAIGAAQKQQEFDLKIQQMQQDLALKLEDNERKNTELMMSVRQQQDDLAKTQAETLKIIREAMGVDAIVGPQNTQAYQNQAQSLNETTQD